MDHRPDIPGALAGDPAITGKASLDHCPVLPRSLPGAPSITARCSLDHCPVLPRSLPGAPSIATRCSLDHYRGIVESPARHPASTNWCSLEHCRVLDRPLKTRVPTFGPTVDPPGSLGVIRPVPLVRAVLRRLDTLLEAGLVLGSRSFSPQGEPGGGCLGGVPPVRPRPPATGNPGHQGSRRANRRPRSGASDLRARPGAHPAERHRLGTPGDDAPCTSSASGVGELFGPDVLVLLARSDSPAVGEGRGRVMVT